MEHNFWWAFLLTLFAGLSTGIGSAIGIFVKRTNFKILSFAMGFSAGVMIYISFTELFVEGRSELIHELGEAKGNLAITLSFFVGILFIALIDKLIPNFENPHEFNTQEDLKNNPEAVDYYKNQKLMRVGLFTAIALAIHNFPEGIATFAGAYKDITIGIPIAIAIAIHNIPEGLSVSVPIYYATGSKKKAFMYSFISGLAEPLGGLIGFLLLMPFFSNTVFGMLFGFIAGIMVFISLDQLLPAAERYGEHHISIYGLVAGMAVMAVSIILLDG